MGTRGSCTADLTVYGCNRGNLAPHTVVASDKAADSRGSAVPASEMGVEGCVTGEVLTAGRAVGLASTVPGPVTCGAVRAAMAGRPRPMCVGINADGTDGAGTLPGN
jgi:hypothetical protein